MECRCAALSLIPSNQIHTRQIIVERPPGFFNSLPMAVPSFNLAPDGFGYSYSPLGSWKLGRWEGDGRRTDRERISCNSCISSSIFQGEREALLRLFSTEHRLSSHVPFPFLTVAVSCSRPPFRIVLAQTWNEALTLLWRFWFW